MMDFADIQGLVRSGYGQLTACRLILLRVADPAAARAWIARAPITTAADLATPRPTALNLAFTAEGLRELGVAEPVLAQFDASFIAGMGSDEARSRRLGDTGANAPAGWDWGVGKRLPHALLLAYAAPEALDGFLATLDWTAGFTVLAQLPTAWMDGREPFGFADGLSQPAIDWSGTPNPDQDAHLTYANTVAAGEMLLGHANEYGTITERPLLPPEADPHNLLAEAEDAPGLRDLGRNGTYLVHRQLHQDVAGFWRAMRDQGGENWIALAETVVGRRMDGSAMLPPCPAAIPGIDPDDRAANNFTFDPDPDGLACPLGAHIRRANPRNADLPPSGGAIGRLLRNLGLTRQNLRDDLVSPTRFHRILRRGRDYGTQLSPEAALAGPVEESGLHFICLNTNIARQFEFVQGAWLAGRNFDGLSGENDPLTAGADTYSIPQPHAANRRLTGLPAFVTLRGGAYFFLPGMRALRWIGQG